MRAIYLNLFIKQLADLLLIVGKGSLAQFPVVLQHGLITSGCVRGTTSVQEQEFRDLRGSCHVERCLFLRFRGLGVSPLIQQAENFCKIVAVAGFELGCVKPRSGKFREWGIHRFGVLEPAPFGGGTRAGGLGLRAAFALRSQRFCMKSTMPWPMASAKRMAFCLLLRNCACLGLESTATSVMAAGT